MSGISYSKILIIRLITIHLFLAGPIKIILQEDLKSEIPHMQKTLNISEY